MRMAIVGSRDFRNLDKVQAFVRLLDKDIIIVSGGARGVDRVAEREAEACGLQTMIFPAQWDIYGKRAGFVRNREIVAHADELVAFWDGKSKGTAHSIELAQQKGIPVLVIDEE